MMFNLADLARKLGRGTRRSRELVEDCLGRIESPDGEGAKAFMRVYADEARRRADFVDQARGEGWSLPPFAGIPIAVKDLFDIAGETTRAGSAVLDEAEPAKRDAPVVARLRAAGFIVIGKNTMTEFAYSGIGLNARFGTPLSPHDRSTGHIPGGSSSGAGVSVSDGLAAGAIGTDTGGSCRIPAAFCGVVGMKPSTGRIPREGMVPLSKSLDAPGPLANTVSCCAILDAVMAQARCPESAAEADVESFPDSGLRIGVLEGSTTHFLDDAVSAAYEAMLIRLSQRGVRLMPLRSPEFEALDQLHQLGSIAGAEGYAWHRPWLASRREHYEPWIRNHIESGGRLSAADYLYLVEERARLRRAFDHRTRAYDALLMPTVQIAPPHLAYLQADPERASIADSLCLHNTTYANFFDRPAISIPCHPAGALPAGAMLIGETGQDRRLLAIARGLEFAIRHP